MRHRIVCAGVFFCSVAITSLLTACGQKGDLYLPEPKQPEPIVEQNSLVQSDSEDVSKKKKDR